MYKVSRVLFQLLKGYLGGWEMSIQPSVLCVVGGRRAEHKHTENVGWNPVHTNRFSTETNYYLTYLKTIFA